MVSESKIVSTDTACHICGAQQLNHFPDYHTLPRVTSDCTPWRAGGKLAICQACTCVQNPVDEQWQSETSEIYGQYKIYTQSAGNEQGVFSDSNQAVPRSVKIFQHATPYLNFKNAGRLLDVGCANGELLRCFGKIAPDWKMAGFEIDDKRRKEVESIPGVEEFASGSLNKIEKTFDIITLVHVLEHLQNPGLWLQELKRLLNPNGVVLIQVPDPKINPFNLLVADHCSHFVMQDLHNIAQQAGYEVLTYSDSWVPREYSLLIRSLPSPDSKKEGANPHIMGEKVATYPGHSIQWLHDIMQLAKTFPKDKPRGIWGTAIAATWLYSAMDSNVDFFVDEDPNRIGLQHLGRPIYSPERAPVNSNIFIALTPEVAAKIVSKYSHLNVSLHVPPGLAY